MTLISRGPPLIVVGAPVRMHTRVNFLLAREALLGSPSATPGSGGKPNMAGAGFWREQCGGSQYGGKGKYDYFCLPIPLSLARRGSRTWWQVRKARVTLWKCGAI